MEIAAVCNAHVSPGQGKCSMAEKPIQSNDWDLGGSRNQRWMGQNDGKERIQRDTQQNWPPML